MKKSKKHKENTVKKEEPQVVRQEVDYFTKYYNAYKNDYISQYYKAYKEFKAKQQNQ
ncbi:MAG: hypothetical protein QM214_05615 [Bacillota bacterium]|jgi:hypothetical protein|nr:hypothetical protein [Bacillota bacterium]HHU43688.1 hypothetical protein [Clostridiales bacterium]